VRELISWAVVFAFYGFGLGVLQVPNPKRIIAARVFFVLGAISATGATIMSGVSLSDNLWIRLTVSFFLFGLIGAGTIEAIRFAAHTQKVETDSNTKLDESGHVKIFLSDKGYFETTEIHFHDVNDFQKGIFEASRANVGKTVNIPPNQQITPFNVVIRNTSKVKIRNAHVSLDANTNISPITNGAHIFSPTQISWDIPFITPYNDIGEEYMLSFAIPTPTSITDVEFTVVVYGDNLEKYAALGGVMFVHQSQSEVAQPTPTASLPQDPAKAQQNLKLSVGTSPHPRKPFETRFILKNESPTPINKLWYSCQAGNVKGGSALALLYPNRMPELPSGKSQAIYCDTANAIPSLLEEIERADSILLSVWVFSDENIKIADFNFLSKRSADGIIVWKPVP
jgi:multisubunit Na+/H+ antiporter MnhG subunit